MQTQRTMWHVLGSRKRCVFGKSLGDTAFPAGRKWNLICCMHVLLSPVNLQSITFLCRVLIHKAQHALPALTLSFVSCMPRANMFFLQLPPFSCTWTSDSVFAVCRWIQHGRSVWRLVCCTAPPCGDFFDLTSNILTHFYHLKIPLTICLFFFYPSSISLGHIRLGAQQQALQLRGGAGLRRQARQRGSGLSHLPRRHRSWAGVRLLPGRLRHWQRLPFFPRGRVLERRRSAATTAHRRGLPRTLYADNLSLQRQHPQLWQQQVSEHQTTPKPKPLSTPITSRGRSPGGARLFRERGNSRKRGRS